MILITGGLGYLGGRIADHLLKTGHTEIALGTCRSCVKVPFALKECKITTIDLLDDESLDRACKGVSVIIHLAALNAQACVDDPEKALMINGLGTLKLLQAATRKGVSKFIYFSTAHVYGSPLIGKLNEDTLPRPVHPYAITHRVAEDYVIEASVKGDVDGVILRLSNAIGAPLDSAANCWMLIVNDLCRQAVESMELKLQSSGLQQRNFISINDVVRVVESIAYAHDGGDTGEIYNLGGDKSISVIEIAKLVAARYKKESRILLEVKMSKEDLGSDESELDYQVGKVISAGYLKSITPIEHDIDEVLYFCRKTFTN